MLPELTEAEAKGVIASVYADIRDTMSMVTYPSNNACSARVYFQANSGWS